MSSKKIFQTVFSKAQKNNFTYIGALVLLTVIGYFTFITILRLSESYELILDSYQAREYLGELTSETLLSQTDARTYYAAKDSAFLTSYIQREEKLTAIVDSIRRIFSDERYQNQVREIQETIQQRKYFNDNKIALVQSAGIDSAERVFPSFQSQNYLHTIKTLSSTLDEEKKAELKRRTEMMQRRAFQMILVIIIGGIASVSLLLIVFVQVKKEIAKRRNAEKEVYDSAQRLLDFLDAVPAGIFILTADGKPFFANKEAKNILGLETDIKILTGNFSELFPLVKSGTNEIYPKEELAIYRTLRGERTVISDAELQRGEEVVPLFITGVPICNAENMLQYGMVVFIDVSEQRESRNKLAESEERHRQFIENATDCIYRTDARGNFVYVNPVGLRMFGYTEKEISGIHYTDIIAEEDRETVKRFYMKQILSKTLNTYYEFTSQKKTGEKIILGQNVQLLIEKNAVVGFQALARDITEQKLAENELARRQQQLDTVISVVDEGITLSDETGTFFIFNQKMEEITGYTKAEANLSDNFTELLYQNEQDQRESLDRLNIVFEKGILRDVETTIHSKTGEIKTLLISTRLVVLKNEKYFLSAWREISERKKFEEELVKAKEAAEAATIAKSQFLATMSHEIRTPMNGVIGMTDLLLHTPLTQEQREFTETIRISGETLLTLINDILDFSKIESGKLELESHPIEIEKFIEETFDLVAHRAVEKSLDLLYFVEPSVPQYVAGDAIRLRQIILNIVNNAIKFTHEGEVYVHVEEVDSTEIKTELRFSVKDTGIGIPPDKMDRLFQAFSQVDASTTRKFGGTGLGLAITKRLVELMDGEVHVESEEKKGSTFSFTVVLEKVSDAALQPKRYVKGNTPELLGRRILIVDDNTTNNKILAVQCKNWGLIPRTTNSPDEALAWVQAGDPFDIAIVDYHMAAMNGVQLAKSIKNFLGEKTFPMILFSSSAKHELPKEERELFADIVTKPIKQSVMFQAITNVFTGTEKIKFQARQQPTVQMEKIAEKFPLTILVAEDNLVNQKLAVRLFQQLGYEVDIAGNGLKVLDLLEQKKYHIIFMDVHMPEMDGLETTRRIARRYPHRQRPKIIAMTADAMSGDKEKCLDAGMDDYLSKPVRLEVLRNTLAYYGEIILNKSASDERGERKLSIKLRMNEILEYADAAFVKELLASTIEQTREMLREIHSAVQQQNAEAVRIAAHKFRGIALNAGAKHLAQICSVVEDASSVNAVIEQNLIDQLVDESTLMMSHIHDVVDEMG